MNTRSLKWAVAGVGVIAIAILSYVFIVQNTKSANISTITIDREVFQAFQSLGPEGPTYKEERALLPNITGVEKWQQIAEPISDADNFAPGIIALEEGGYRIFWNDYQKGGITSATSADGITFVKDQGLRITETLTGNNCFASHPWLVAIEGGYRMYYGGKCEDNQPDGYQIYTAFSSDGLSFQDEGIVIGTGEETGLTFAGHGRILKLKDGTYRMFFSANTKTMESNEPSAILGAVSSDGIHWTLDAAITLEMGHDPAIIWKDGKAHMYVSFLSRNTLHLISDNGYSFTPVSWMEFYDAEGNRFGDFGDVEALVAQDGSILIYGSGKLENSQTGFPGILPMKEIFTP